jgi:hypothetical protein
MHSRDNKVYQDRLSNYHTSLSRYKDKTPGPFGSLRELLSNVESDNGPHQLDPSFLVQLTSAELVMGRLRGNPKMG